MKNLSRSSSTSSELHQSFYHQKTGSKVFGVGNPSRIRHSSNILDTPKMAGDISAVDQKKPRKCWSLQDRSDHQIDLLKAHLADDGDEECQLDMAKKLLADNVDNTMNSAHNRENARLAIYWLIKSGEQGNEEATLMLNQCLKSGLGITCQNISDVRSCVGTSKNEKLVFKAARLLYDKLSNGEEFITTSQILRVIKSSKLKHGLDSSSISFKHLASSTLNDDALNKTFTVDEDDEDVMNHTSSSDIDTVKQLMQQNDVVKLTRNDLLKLASEYNSGEIPHIAITCHTRQNQRYNWKLMSLSHAFLLQFLLLSLVTKALTLHSIFIVLASFLTLWTCFNFFIWRNKIIIFEEWTTAFKSMLRNKILHDMPNRKRLWSKRIRPLSLTNIACLLSLYFLSCSSPINFILATVTLVSIFRGIFHENLTWQTKFIILTTIIFSQSFTNYQQDIFLHISTYINDVLPHFSVSEQGEWSNILIQDYWEELGLPSLNIQMMLMAVNITIILVSFLRSNETNINSFFEQLVILLQLTQMDAAIFTMTMNELLFASGVATIVLVFFYLLEQNNDLLNIILGTLITLIFVVGSVIALVVVSNSYGITKNVNGNVPLKHITWDEYSTHCHRKAWTDKTIPETQIRCTHMYGSIPTFVKWSGKISNIKISHLTTKPFSKSISSPGEMIMIGEVTFEVLVNVENLSDNNEGGQSWQNLLTGSKEPMNIILMSISTQSIIGSKEKVKAVQQLLRFRVGDHIEFHGLLLNGHGTLKPEVGKISSLKCLECQRAVKGQEFSFASDSFTLQLLENFEEYVGSQLIHALSELEANIFTLFH